MFYCLLSPNLPSQILCAMYYLLSTTCMTSTSPATCSENPICATILRVPQVFIVMQYFIVRLLVLILWLSNFCSFFILLSFILLFLASFIILCNANHSAHVGHFSHSHSCTSAMMWQFWHCGFTHAHEHYFVRPFRFLSSNDFDSDDPGFKAKKSYLSRATMVMNGLRGEAVSRGVQWVFS